MVFKLRLFFVLCFLSSNSYTQIYFENQASTLGFDNLTLGDTYLGNGVSFRDFNNDGWDDISFASGDGEDIYFFENVNGVFVNNNFNLPLMDYQTKSLNWVDIDNDGDKDLYVLSNTVAGNRLFLNQGNEVFTEITISSGLPLGNIESYSASWGDYDNDGYLDVFICNRGEGVSSPNFLFRNNGDNTFQDVSAISGISNDSDLTFCAAFFDINNDGWQDIYVINDKAHTTNIMYKNNGDGTFLDISESSGTGIGIDAMTSTIGDFNNDGWFDIYITNTQAGNVLFMNNGDETFSDITATSGTGFFSIGWGAVFLDAENDMDLDLYVSGELDGSFGGYLSAAFYKNTGSNTFNILTNAGFIGDNGKSFSNAIGDIDNDGYPDIVVNNSDEEMPFLWKNETTQNNNWLKVKLNGTISNKDGIGSVIEISVNNEKQYRYTLCNEGYLAQNSETEFFGLGNFSSIDYIKVTWLSGMIDYIENVTSNQLYEIIEGSNPLSIINLEIKNNIKTFPNPTTNYVTISAETNIQSIQLLDVVGNVMFSKQVGLQQFELDLSRFSSGIYFIKVYQLNGTKSIKIIKY